MDVETEKITKEREKSDVITKQKKRCCFKSPTVANKRLKTMVNEDTTKLIKPMNKKIKKSHSSADKLPKHSKKKYSKYFMENDNSVQNQNADITHDPADYDNHSEMEENADTKGEHNITEVNKFKQCGQENSMNLISQCIIKTLDNTFFNEDSNEMLNTLTVKSNIENITMPNTDEVHSSIPNENNYFELQEENINCKLSEGEIAIEISNGEINISTSQETKMEDVALNAICKETFLVKKPNFKIKISADKEALNLENKENIFTLIKENTIKTLKGKELQKENEGIHAESKNLTEIASTFGGKCSMEGKNDIVKSDTIIKDLLSLKKNARDIKLHFQQPQVVEKLSLKKEDESPMTSIDTAEKYTENCENKNDHLKEKKDVTIGENKNTENETDTKLIEIPNEIGICKVDEKINSVSVNNRSKTFSVKYADTTHKENKVPLTSNNILSNIDTLDKNLAEKEKKLTLLYMNALDYAMDFKKEADILDGENETSIVDHSDNFEANAIKNAQFNSTTCGKNVLEKMCNTNNLSKLNEKYSHFDSSKAICDNIENDLGQKKYISEDDNDIQSYKGEILNSDNLMYDQCSMKSINGRTIQINFEYSNIKDIDINFNKEYNILTNYASAENKQENVLKQSVDKDTKPVLDQNNLPRINDIKNKEDKFENFRENYIHVSESHFRVPAGDFFKKDAAVTENSPAEETSNSSSNENSIKRDKNEEIKNENEAIPFYDSEDCFDMEDDFILTASQLNMIETDEKNQVKAMNQVKNSYQQTEHCTNTHFGLDSITVEVIDQLCCLRESVDSIKELLQTALKKKTE